MAVENKGTNRRLVDLAALQPNDRALDVGCGPGTAVRHSVRIAGVIATGIDASSTAIRVARALSHRGLHAGRLRLEVADVTALPYVGRRLHGGVDDELAAPLVRSQSRARRAPPCPSSRAAGCSSASGAHHPRRASWSPPGLSDEAVSAVVELLEAAGFDVAPPEEQAVRKDRFVVIRGAR